MERIQAIDHALSVLEWYAESSSGKEEENIQPTIAAMNILQSLKNNQVTVEVSGGVAEITSCPEGVVAEIIDHDNA